MYVELWANSGGKSRIMALIRVVDGGVQVEEKEPVPPRIRKDIEKHRQYTKSDDEFLRTLPTEFSGTYYRATLIKD